MNQKGKLQKHMQFIGKLRQPEQPVVDDHASLQLARQLRQPELCQASLNNWMGEFEVTVYEDELKAHLSSWMQ